MARIGDRFRGVMVGTAVGDGLGRPMEGAREVDPSYIEELVERSPLLPYTDDTVLTIALAESLLACGGFSGPDMADRFASAWQAEPARGYGAKVVVVFEEVLRGVPWDEAARRQFGGEGSYGNGGAMRVAPVALWAYPDLEETIRLARETARVTHTHPVGSEGAVIQAVAVHHALRTDFDRGELLSDLGGIIESERFRSRLEVLHDGLQRDDDDWARSRLGTWVSADQSVLTALYCFLLAHDFRDTIIRAVRLGGDTDTIAAMAGALAGARWGLAQIPDDWRKVEGYDRLIEIAEALARRLDAGLI